MKSLPNSRTKSGKNIIIDQTQLKLGCILGRKHNVDTLKGFTVVGGGGGQTFVPSTSINLIVLLMSGNPDVNIVGEVEGGD